MKSLSLLIFFISFHAFGERLTTRVYRIENSGDSRPHLILFENGHVGFLSAKDYLSLSSLEESRRRGDWIEAELDGQGNFLGAGIVPAPKEYQSRNDPVSENTNYEPTNLTSIEEADSIFLSWRRTNNGQCYNRAHVWTYEAYQSKNLHSMKLFMFFTRTYIRQYRYKWWFHVTPMTYVNNIPMTLDRAFMKGPVEIKTWTDEFIYSKRDCPIIHRYSEYRDHQDTEHCYLHPASMFFWQPSDLENFENTGAEKKQFYDHQIRRAYRDISW